MSRTQRPADHRFSYQRAARLLRARLWRAGGAIGLGGLACAGVMGDLRVGGLAAALAGAASAVWHHAAWTRTARRLTRRANRPTTVEDRDRQLARAAMTERRLVDVAANLRAAQSQLEADMAARQAMADQLAVALVRAGEANRAKSAFLASMSHELRTPLNAIIGFSDLMLRNKQELAGSHRTYLERINRGGRHLLAIINDILDLSRIEAGKVVVELCDTDLAPVVQEVIELHATHVAAGVTLEADVPPGPLLVSTDGMRLRQVLVNLVSNALKFTPQGRVVVRVALNEHGAPARIDVVDSGVGIAADRLEAIFEPFEQADNSTARTHGGTGLGLAICRQLCALLDTHLTVTSTVGVGTTFSLHLPVAGNLLHTRDLAAARESLRPTHHHPAPEVLVP
ncbi:MAG: hypothetical protein JNJ98_12640 [Gemmatimonadetes bacterium]|nr:hypothetical protein [Gemmatimonadota bacterium]